MYQCMVTGFLEDFMIQHFKNDLRPFAEHFKHKKGVTVVAKSPWVARVRDYRSKLCDWVSRCKDREPRYQSLTLFERQTESLGWVRRQQRGHRAARLVQVGAGTVAVGPEDRTVAAVAGHHVVQGGGHGIRVFTQRIPQAPGDRRDQVYRRVQLTGTKRVPSRGHAKCGTPKTSTNNENEGALLP